MLFFYSGIICVCGRNQEADKDAMMKEELDFTYETVGPSGEEPTDYSNVVISAADRDTIQSGNYKAAILLHTSADWTNAVIAGAQSMFDSLGIEVVAITDAEFDPNKQRADIETALALKPDIILTLVLDPVSGAEALRQAIAQGVTVVLLSNLPEGFSHGDDYAAIVTDDLFNMGRSVAEMIGEDLDGKGDVGLLFHDANYYVTNQRDQAVEAVLLRDFPDINIVAKQGIADPNDGEAVASALLTRYPDIDAIYAPWDTIAEGVVAAVRTVNRDVGVYTIDLGANNILNMVTDGNVRGVVADLPFNLGETMAAVGALGAIGISTPPFITVPAIKINKDNVAEGWKKSLNRELPPEILSEL